MIKMKALLVIPALMVLASCGPGSSPEGRSKLRDQAIQTQIDSLKNQTKALTDSMANMSKELRELKGK